MNNNNGVPNAGRILFLLFLANFLNFFDRALPAMLVEPIRHEWGLTDLHAGIVAAAFTLIYALAGIPLGKLADVWSRKKVIGYGLGVWSGFTALNAAAWNFWSFLGIRVGVGIGEASYAPAANSLIGDLYPAKKRARAMGLFMLGLPLGTLAAFWTIGAMVEYFGNWRTPFIIAAIPGFFLAVIFFFIKEPARGGQDLDIALSSEKKSWKALLAVPTFRWIIASGITLNIAAYAGGTFLVPLLQRHFGESLQSAGFLVGVILGVTGLISLSVGGFIADALQKRHVLGRMLFGVIGMAIAAGATFAALVLAGKDVAVFTALFSIGWLMLFNYYTSVYPSIQDLVQPSQRALAMALYFACMYVLGGAFGPLILGGLSDYLAHHAMTLAGASQMTEAFIAEGLYGAMYIIPVALLLTALFLALGLRTYQQDAQNMKEGA